MTPPTGRGILTTLKKLQLLPFRILVVLDIPFDLISRHPVADGSNEVPVFPELASPQVLLDPRKLFEDLARADALQHPDYLSDGISGRKAEENMDVVGCDFHLFDCESMVICDFLE